MDTKPKPVLMEWDEEEEDWMDVWTPEAEEAFWAEESERSERQLREAREKQKT